MTKSSSSTSSDTPISSRKEDKFGRANFAENLAKSIAGIDAKDGFVFALNAPWGSGKTSTLKMVQECLEEDSKVGDGKQFIIVNFNPWWFSGGNALIQEFFCQFRGALIGQGKDDGTQQKLRHIAGKIRIFASVLTPFPVFGEWAKRAGDMAGGMERLFADPFESIHEIREDIHDSLRKMPDLRVLVIMDDLDRIQPNEMWEMFRLVKGVADFPNTIYLLSFDRDSVVDAISNSGNGKENIGKYMGKIIQMSMPLPPVNKVILHDWFRQKLDIAIPARQDEWDDDYWMGLFIDVADYFVDTPRNAKRWLNNIGVTYPAVVGEVNPVDFAAIQGLWTFVPDIYHKVQENPSMFVQRSVTDSSGLIQEEQQYRKKLADEISKMAGSHAGPVQSILGTIFPNWKHPLPYSLPEVLAKSYQHKFARHPVIFDRYFNFSLAPGDFSSREWAEIISCASDPEKFVERMINLSKEEILTPQKSPVRSKKNMTRLRSFLKLMTEHVKDEGVVRHAAGILRAFLLIGDRTEVDDGWNSSYMERIVRGILHEKSNNTPFEICQPAFKEGSAIVLMMDLLRIFQYILEECKKEEFNEPPILQGSQCKKLEDIVKGKLCALAQKNELHTYCRQPLSLLCFFGELVGKIELHDYVERIITTDKEFADFLVYPCQEVGVRYPGGIYSYIKPSKVMDVTGQKQNDLVARCNKILADCPPWLNEERKEALKLLVKGVEKPDFSE